MNTLNLSLRTLLLAAAVAGQPVWAATATIPVQPLPSAKATPKPRAATPLPAPRYWLSAMVGLGGADEASLAVKGWGLYAVNDGVLVGARLRYSEGFSSVRHGREAALLVGRPFGRSASAWWAAGVGRFALERRSPPPEGYRREVIGLPLELVYAPHGQRFGLELRGELNLNAIDPQITAGLGLSFGAP